MFFLFGFGTKQQGLGPGATRTCPACSNTTTWARVRQYRQLSVFFLPLLRWKHQTLEVCGICGATVEA